MLLLTIRILYMKKPENRFLIRSYPKDQLMESHAWPMVLSSTYRSWAMVLLSTSSGFFFLFFSFMIRIIKEILFIIGNYALSSIPLSLQRLVFWHQEVASDSFCFLINSSWLSVFILIFFFLFFSGFNLYCWKGIHFS